MAALGPGDPPDPMHNSDGTCVDDETYASLTTVDLHYLALYRDALEAIAHGPDFPLPCPDDQFEAPDGSRDVRLRCPRCYAREVLES